MNTNNLGRRYINYIKLKIFNNIQFDSTINKQDFNLSENNTCQDVLDKLRQKIRKLLTPEHYLLVIIQIVDNDPSRQLKEDLKYIISDDLYYKFNIKIANTITIFNKKIYLTNVKYETLDFKARYDLFCQRQFNLDLYANDKKLKVPGKLWEKAKLFFLPEQMNTFAIRFKNEDQEEEIGNINKIDFQFKISNDWYDATITFFINNKPDFTYNLENIDIDSLKYTIWVALTKNGVKPRQIEFISDPFLNIEFSFYKFSIIEKKQIQNLKLFDSGVDYSFLNSSSANVKFSSPAKSFTDESRNSFELEKGLKVGIKLPIKIAQLDISGELSHQKKEVNIQTITITTKNKSLLSIHDKNYLFKHKIFKERLAINGYFLFTVKNFNINIKSNDLGVKSYSLVELFRQANELKPDLFDLDNRNYWLFFENQIYAKFFYKGEVDNYKGVVSLNYHNSIETS